METATQTATITVQGCHQKPLVAEGGRGILPRDVIWWPPPRWYTRVKAVVDVESPPKRILLSGWAVSRAIAGGCSLHTQERRSSPGRVQ